MIPSPDVPALSREQRLCYPPRTSRSHRQSRKHDYRNSPLAAKPDSGNSSSLFVFIWRRQTHKEESAYLFQNPDCSGIHVATGLGINRNQTASPSDKYRIQENQGLRISIPVRPLRYINHPLASLEYEIIVQGISNQR